MDDQLFVKKNNRLLREKEVGIYFLSLLILADLILEKRRKKIRISNKSCPLLGG